MGQHYHIQSWEDDVIPFTDDTAYVEMACVFCAEDMYVEVPYQGFLAWLEGELIQNAMPDVDPESREKLISRTCSECRPW